MRRVDSAGVGSPCGRRRLLLLLLTAYPASVTSAICGSGFTHDFDGYHSCALESARPCATKVMEGAGISVEMCIAQCRDACVAISLFEHRECWVYTALPSGGKRRPHFP